MNYSYASLGVAATLTLAGCSIDNPLFELTNGISGATDASASAGSTSVTPTGEPVTSTSVESGGSGTSQTATSSDSQGTVDPQTATSVDPQTSGSSDVGVDTSSGSNETSVGTGVETGVAECGNGIAEVGEACDDGNTDPGDGCTEFCTLEDPGVCGDGFVDGDEQCDLGAQNSDAGNCTSFCKHAGCGDGLLLAGVEECDEGAQNSASGACTAECHKAFCGDSLVQDNVEGCDDGDGANAWEVGKCSKDCQPISAEVLKVQVLTVNQDLVYVTGNFNDNPGLAGGDLLCAKNFGNYKALVSDGINGARVGSKTAFQGDGQSPDWVLEPYRGYVNAVGKLVFVTGAEALLGVRNKAPWPLQNPVNGPLTVWTGMSKGWVPSDTNCLKWTSKAEQATGGVAGADKLDGNFIGTGLLKPCSNQISLYCVQQPG